MEGFEVVWSTINEEFYDPTFGGIDWDASHDRYLPEVAAATDNESFATAVNAMLFELDVSHLVVTPPARPDLLGPAFSLRSRRPTSAARGTRGSWGSRRRSTGSRASPPPSSIGMPPMLRTSSTSPSPSASRSPS